MDKELAIKILSEDTSKETIRELKEKYSYDEIIKLIQESMNLGIEAINKTSIKDCEGCYYRKYCLFREIEELDYCSHYSVD